MELYRGEWSDKEYLAESEIIYEEKNNLKKIYYIFDVNSICDSRQQIFPIYNNIFESKKKSVCQTI